MQPLKSFYAAEFADALNVQLEIKVLLNANMCLQTLQAIFWGHLYLGFLWYDCSLKNELDSVVSPGVYDDMFRRGREVFFTAC